MRLSEAAQQAHGLRRQLGAFRHIGHLPLQRRHRPKLIDQGGQFVLLGLASQLELASRGDEPPAMIYLDDERPVEAVLPPELIDDLERMGDWVVECDGRLVLIYRHESAVSV